LALLDLDVDPDDVLPHDASRTDIQVAVRIHCQWVFRATDKAVKRQTQLPNYP
jgi:hypothetical protein